MDKFVEELRKLGFKGETDDSNDSLEFYSHDASLFEIKPSLIVFPRNSDDIKILVNLVKDNKEFNPNLSLTARSAGTDMAGGAINDSIIIDFTKHLNNIDSVSSTEATTQPGVYYRDFEKATLKHNALMPSYPASRDLASVGGIAANNSGGEKSLEYGKTTEYVKKLTVVLADGNEYVLQALHKDHLDEMMAQDSFIGNIYKQVYQLCEDNYDLIKTAKPKVSKNSMGYNLWDVWNRETKLFDITKLFVGSEGTLGMITDITFRLVPYKKHSGLLVLFLKDMDALGEIIPKVLEYHPATFESFDDQTLILSLKFMGSFLKMLGVKKFIKLLISLIPDGLQLIKGIPKLILMVEFTSDSEEEVRQKVKILHRELKQYKARYEINGFEEDPTEGSSEKFWIMRRQSFQLLRSKVKDKHTAPFIDDLIVRPEFLVKFLPQLRTIIKKYKLFATIAGHMGDGNFHIIPLMKLEDESEKAKLLPAMKEVNDLVLSFDGSLSGEHNDGLVRGPWLKNQFGEEILGLFKEVKTIFDKQNIFNPHKKSDSDWDFSYSHIRDKF